MDKIKINGTEIELNMNSMQQLSEEELQTISGGFQPMKSMRFYSWICKTCYAEGATFTAYDSAFREAMVAHKTATGHCEFIGLSAIYMDGGGYGINGYWTETV
jgi:bacteriocin-like protein